MVKNLDNDEKNTESIISFRKQLENGLLFMIEKTKDIVDRLPKEEALNKIDELKKDKTNLNYYPLFDIANDYLNGKIEKLGKNGYLSSIQNFMDEEVDGIDKKIDAIIRAGLEKQTVDEVANDIVKKYPNITEKEAKEIAQEASDEYKAGINDNVVEDAPKEKEEGPVGSVTENIKEDFKDVPRPEIKEDAKQIYKYSVEKKITSGIPELDQFLGIIQPALNQFIIIPWKFFYEGLDATKASLDKFENWRSQNSSVRDTFNEFKNMGIVPGDTDFKPGWNLKENEIQTAGYFNQFLCQKLNEELEARKQTNFASEVVELMNEKNISKDEAIKRVNAKYEPRKKFFDFSKESDIPNEVLTKTFISFIERDKDGKVTKESQAKLKAFMNGIDLFNKKDKDTIPSKYANVIIRIMKGLEESTFGKDYIENRYKEIYDELKEEEADEKQASLIAKHWQDASKGK